MERSKEQLRNDLIGASEKGRVSQHGRIAEVLRKDGLYKKAFRVYCGPAKLLSQVRINVLLDGKELVMPGPGMKEGFFLVKPYTVPFRDMLQAVTYKGLGKYGKRLDNSDLKGLDIDLLIDHVIAVDQSGFFLGDGKGFFDLALAVLAETGGLADDFHVVAALDDPGKVIAELPRDSWDITCSALLTPAGIDGVPGDKKRPQIVWDHLDMDRIKRVTPLWKHYVATREKRSDKASDCP